MYLNFLVIKYIIMYILATEILCTMHDSRSLNQQKANPWQIENFIVSKIDSSDMFQPIILDSNKTIIKKQSLDIIKPSNPYLVSSI
jgi:hypothetical protein